ncbi:MAG: aldehyde dehydrogenase family protein [Rubripirellula sp.]
MHHRLNETKTDLPWSSVSIKERCRRVASARKVIAENGEFWADLCRRDWRPDRLTTVSGELLPLCAALHWIGRRAPQLLRSRRLPSSTRPIWLWGVRNEIHHQPRGKVLILGSWNYPLFLVGVQIAQALAAGNRVLFKPAEGCEEIGAELVRAFHQCGVPPEALEQINSSAGAAIAAIEQGVDLIVLTGSAQTGRAVFRQAAQSLTPMILELSGCDAVVVCPSADTQRVAECIKFGLTFNSGATCIGPRRLIGVREVSEAVSEQLVEKLASVEPQAIHPAAKDSVVAILRRAFDEGAYDLTGRFSLDELERTGYMTPLVLGNVRSESEIAKADIFAPVISRLDVASIEDAVSIVNQCRYRLAASVFGSKADAAAISDQLAVGSVTINDLIVPTADPRVSFGGRGESGFGVTRGEEGLMSMTVPVLKSRRRGTFVPHLIFNREKDSSILLSVIRLQHGGNLRLRLKGLWQLISSFRK